MDTQAVGLAFDASISCETLCAHLSRAVTYSDALTLRSSLGLARTHSPWPRAVRWTEVYRQGGIAGNPLYALHTASDSMCVRIRFDYATRQLGAVDDDDRSLLTSDVGPLGWAASLPLYAQTDAQAEGTCSPTISTSSPSLCPAPI